MVTKEKAKKVSIYSAIAISVISYIIIITITNPLYQAGLIGISVFLLAYNGMVK